MAVKWNVPVQYAELQEDKPSPFHDAFKNNYHGYPKASLNFSQGSLFAGGLPVKLEIVATFPDGHQETVTFQGGIAELKLKQSMYHGQKCDMHISGLSVPQYNADSGPAACVLPTGCLMRCHVIKEDKENGE